MACSEKYPAPNFAPSSGTQECGPNKNQYEMDASAQSEDLQTFRGTEMLRVL